MSASISALFGGAAGGVAFDDEDFAEGGVFFGAVGEFAGEPTAGEDAFADGLSGFACGFSGAGSVEAFVDDFFGDFGLGLEVEFELVADDFLHDAVDFTVGELGLGLAFESGFGYFDGDDSGEAFADVVAAEGGVFVFEEVVSFGVLVDDACEGGSEAGEVGAAFDVVNGVGVGVDLVVVAAVVLQGGVDNDVGVGGCGLGFALGCIRAGGLAVEGDWVFMEGFFAVVEKANVLGDAVFEEEGVGFVGVFVYELDVDAWVEEGELAEAFGDDVVLEFAGGEEDFWVGEEGDFGAGCLSLADGFEFLGGASALEGHGVDCAVAVDCGFKVFGYGVDAFGTDAVEPAGDLVGAFAEFAAGVEVGEDEFEGGDFVFGVDVDGDAASIVGYGAGAVVVDGDGDGVAVAGEGFVDGVVDDFEDAVVDAAFVSVADVHVGAFADAFEAFEFLNFGSVVNFAGGGCRGHGGGIAVGGIGWVVEHRGWERLNALRGY